MSVAAFDVQEANETRWESLGASVLDGKLDISLLPSHSAEGQSIKQVRLVSFK